MGIKRKASDFEESDDHPATQHNTYSATPSLASSSPVSTSTNQSSASGDAQQPLDFYRVKAVPYWNSRTRKRYRDDRPNEDSIHENTLKKLFDAQRLHLDEATPMSEAFDLDQCHEPLQGEDAEMIDTFPEVELPQIVQHNQRTIDAFFGGRAESQSKTPERQSAGSWDSVGG